MWWELKAIRAEVGWVWLARLWGGGGVAVNCRISFEKHCCAMYFTFVDKMILLLVERLNGDAMHLVDIEVAISTPATTTT